MCADQRDCGLEEVLLGLGETIILLRRYFGALQAGGPS